jgi:long-chain acyl-CoA synthetase
MKLLLDYVYDHEAGQPDRIFLTQPVGNGAVVDLSWAQALDEARRMAAHLRARGIAPGARVALLAKNSAHFILAELAIWMAGGTSVAIFPTETPQNLRYVLGHCEASLLFVGKLDAWEAQRAGVPASLPTIALPLAPATGGETWEAVVARTAPLAGRPARGAEELAMLLYTSGSTGQPKGVMQTFRAITDVAVVTIEDSYVGGQEMPQEARVLSYLPLAHVFERAAIECCALYWGRCRVYFTDTQASFLEDLQRARPTMFHSVPRLWIKFRQGVLARLPAAQLDALLDDPASAAATGRKILAGLGLDCAERAFSGSAPLPPEVLLWYRRLGLNLYEGYAMTEDFCYSHVGTDAARTPGYVGLPKKGVQVRLDEDGEILIKSPGQMAGYYRQPELTAQSFTADGYFRTGDLGVHDEQGQLRIVGRKKELFKTAKGKYVAPAPIENLLGRHPMVELCVVQGLGQPGPHALVVLEESLRPRSAEAPVRHQIEAELARLLEQTNAELAGHERLRFIAVAQEPWSIANGCLTPTLKVKRNRIEESVAGRMAGWYEEAGPVIWA